MFQVIKRDGSKADFTLTKINDAIMKAFNATQMNYNNDIIDLLALRVTADFQKKVENDEIHVEDIQDSVERVLGQAGYEEVAKAYILYRKQREKMRAMKSTILDYKDVVNSYVKVEDWRVKENSTVTYSVGGLILSNSGAVTANYWLSEIYDEEIAEAHRNADIHIHDLSMLTGYCAGWSLKQLIKEGLGGITGKITSAPARHLSVLCNQMVNFLGIMQNEWAGAQAFSSFDTYLAPFVKVDHLSYPEVKKCIEAFIYGVNTPSRWGTQAPFSHIFMDLKVPGDMAGEKAIVGGRRMDFTYGDCQKEMDMVNRAFLETMLEGDANGLGFQYPIPAYGIGADYDWSDTEQNRLLFSLASHYGTPYFINYMGNGMKPEDVRTSYDGIRPDFHVLRKKAGGFFGYGEHTGSVGVVTVNLPRIAYQSKDEKEFYARLDQMMDLAARSLSIKRNVISTLLKNGLYPYTACYLTDFDNHFSSIGVIGMNEAGLNARWLKAGLESGETKKFAVSVLNHMREKLIGYQMEYGNLYGLEATPAESATFRFARLDRERFSGIRTAGHEGDVPYYTNSTKLPADYDGTLQDALINQDSLQPLYTTGTVFHVYMERELEDWRKARDLLSGMITEHCIPCFTLSPVYTICQTCGYLPGRQERCPKCNGAADVYSRIAGYYRPVHDWNDGKAQEFKNRVMFPIGE